jgi:hypothetical protein
MARFRVHKYCVQLLTGKIVNTIRTYFVDFWSKLIGNKRQEQSSMERGNSDQSDKFFGSKRIKSMKKIRRISKHGHFKYLKADKYVIKNDYCHKTKIHCLSFFKSIFVKK